MTIYHKGKNYFCPACKNQLYYLEISMSPEETIINGKCTECNYNFEEVGNITFIQIGEDE